ncbi:guanylate kinase [Spiroplasma sabaudiense Ar-1343]|uniref:Guanylate kinase n=1 Tax=Spiroplasma sabaudiense Ar-1343 TaxID=1276257 RepID=W6AAI2_9MOLU|nr:guanylate kinase [Spiroplasma sabaudiense]AHI54067.1 guanylate kinase [Spiroplasma sabaudiense Ar-1343]
MVNKPGRIIILSGPSGVGKGSVNNELFKDESLNLTYSVSMTTRKPRQGEVDGVNYFFVSREYFEEQISKNAFIEYAEFIGNYYGTPKNYVQKQIDLGKNVILEVEVKGAMQVLAQDLKNEILSIFLMPPSLEELKARIKKRGTESTEIIKQRLDKALLEIPLKNHYRYVIENDNLINAVEKIKDVLQKEGALNKNSKQSRYWKLFEIVNADIIENYQFFLENWKINVQAQVKENHRINNKDFDFIFHLAQLLSDRIYEDVMGHGYINSIVDKDFVKKKIEKLMLEVNFFSLEQTRLD